MFAPFYDLVAIESFYVIRSGIWARKLAFRIGQHDTPKEVSIDDWRNFAKDLGVPEKPTFKRLEELAVGMPDVVTRECSEFSAQHGQNVHEGFEGYIRKWCEWVLGQLR